MDTDRGTRDGIRVNVKFFYHYYPPVPLNAKGEYDLDDLADDQPLELGAPAVSSNLEVPQKPDSEPATNPDYDDQPAPSEQGPVQRLDQYKEYRRLMHQWKLEEEERLEAEAPFSLAEGSCTPRAVSYTHLRAHETPEHLVCRLLLEKKKKESMYHHERQVVVQLQKYIINELNRAV
eukprot:TRINITY_DN26943_c0_g2_i1.p2 TRINITY_DN26943_c0_g2~~TRINITY_DN26943_c0_g2_i1.p2  ORF type:complete len:177 (-),score=43.49 TRINITY_DN26943_c0_g2_i1:9-539(-)